MIRSTILMTSQRLELSLAVGRQSRNWAALLSAFATKVRVAIASGTTVSRLERNQRIGTLGPMDHKKVQRGQVMAMPTRSASGKVVESSHQQVSSKITTSGSCSRLAGRYGLTFHTGTILSGRTSSQPRVSASCGDPRRPAAVTPLSLQLLADVRRLRTRSASGRMEYIGTQRP